MERSWWEVTIIGFPTEEEYEPIESVVFFGSGIEVVKKFSTETLYAIWQLMPEGKRVPREDLKRTIRKIQKRNAKERKLGRRKQERKLAKRRLRERGKRQKEEREKNASFAPINLAELLKEELESKK